MELKWKHPFTVMISGPTGSGKTTFTKRFLKQIDSVTDTKFHEIIYCAPVTSQPDLNECKTTVKFFDCIPDVEMFSDKLPRVVILDDMMREGRLIVFYKVVFILIIVIIVIADDRVVDIFTKNSHHLGLSVIFITQNIFHRGKGMRDISLNSHYIVAYKSPRDRGQISLLARQISPGNTKFVTEIFDDATKPAYGYLVFDLTQTTPDHMRYRTNIFPDDNPPYIVYVAKNFQI